MNRAKLTFLGTGTSQGVPMIGCSCNVCKSADPRDQRLRSSVLVDYCGKRILVDAGPDFRQQMLRARVTHLDAILLTHNHKDHTGGLDDVRAFNYLEKAPTQIYCEKYVEDSLRQEYSYAFAENRYPGAPEWNVHLIDEHPFSIGNQIDETLTWVDGKGFIKHSANNYSEEISDSDQSVSNDEIIIVPIRGKHFKLPVLGFRFGNIAYCTDMNHIADEEFAKLQDLDHFIINCVRRGRHISHFSLEGALEVAKRVGARHTWITHLSHQLPRHADLETELQAITSTEPSSDQPTHQTTSILPAYDGLVIE
ncbi:MAG: MBL fold metallo-hydrolase [Bacteroidales bacterium]|nr:MBL fold metallo-hydrolase [Bacteroidales bacterium]